MKLDVRVAVLTIIALLTLIFVFALRWLKAETDITEALPEWAPAKKAYDRLGELFPSRDFFLVVIETNRFQKIKSFWGSWFFWRR